VEKMASASAVVRKMVRMSEIRDFIPCSQDVGFQILGIMRRRDCRG
jgi:hypothetical protein